MPAQAGNHSPGLFSQTPTRAAPPAPSTQPYWNRAAETYDAAFTNTVLGRLEREAVWKELRRVFRAGQRILELNCGTGVDALYLAERGVRVVACDIAPGMIAVARQRLNASGQSGMVDLRVLPTEEIAALAGEGPFDGAFSNFAGLNMVRDLSAVARNLAALIRIGGRALLCLSGRVVPWEIAWYLAHGEGGKAFQRFQTWGVERREEGVTVCAHYPAIRTMTRTFGPEFRLRSIRGIGLALPPFYAEPWARRYPGVFAALAGADRWLGVVPGLRALAGHVVFQFERTKA